MLRGTNPAKRELSSLILARRLRRLVHALLCVSKADIHGLILLIKSV